MEQMGDDAPALSKGVLLLFLFFACNTDIFLSDPLCSQELYRTMPNRSKDYIKGERKPNGYQSLHETIIGELIYARSSVSDRVFFCSVKSMDIQRL